MTTEVSSIQEALFLCGVYPGKVDGAMGPNTRKAIKAFQEAMGLSVDGDVGPNTRQALVVRLNEVATRAKGLEGFFAGGGTSALDDI